MRSQRGFAMIAIITLVAFIAAYLVANALAQTEASVASARALRTQRALQEAKRGLIAWAASQALQQPESGRHFQPGALPCPAKDDPAQPQLDGDAEPSCGSATTRFGRLPWRTLGIDDLRDASGERLWYALSYNFRKTTTSTVINSDTQGTLTVTGTAPASNAVAVILAPGIALQQSSSSEGALQNQVRDPTSYSAINDPSNYFEGENAGTNDDVFTVPSATSDVSNDRLAVISTADLMDAVEPNVAALMSTKGLSTGVQQTIKDFLNDYYADWGKYPFPAPFTSPDSSDYKGVAGTTEGFLPMTTDAGFVAWQNPDNTSISTLSGTIWPQGCGSSTSTRLDCQFWYNDTSGPVIRISATALNAGLAIVRKDTSSDIKLSSWGVTDYLQKKSDGCSPLVSPSASETYCLQVTSSLSSNGNASLVLTMQLAPRSSWSNEELQIPVPAYSELVAPADYSPPLDSPSDSDAYWFVHNAWYKLVYYAVSPAYLPGGTAPCAGNCLVLNGLPSGPVSDARALLILAGRSINGSARPSSNLSDYLEGENASPGDETFQTHLGAPSGSNDRALVVAP